MPDNYSRAEIRASAREIKARTAMAKSNAALKARTAKAKAASGKGGGGRQRRDSKGRFA